MNAQAAGALMQLVDPHGDIIATIPDTPNVQATELETLTAYTPYGEPRDSLKQPHPYGWEGAGQRSDDNVGGLLQMGARTYNPATGRFLQTDPIPGGTPNPYTYPPDPVNGEDLNGMFEIKRCQNRRANCARVVFSKREMQHAVNVGFVLGIVVVGAAVCKGAFLCAAALGVVGYVIGLYTDSVIKSALIVNVSVHRSRLGRYRVGTGWRWKGAPPEFTNGHEVWGGGGSW